MARSGASFLDNETIRLIGESGSYEAVTDEEGRFRFDGVEPGVYRFEGAGYGESVSPHPEIDLTGQACVFHSVDFGSR